MRSFAFILVFLPIWNTEKVENQLAEALEQLNSRLSSQFELHSRIEFIHQGISQHIKGRLRVNDQNFDKLTDEAGRQIDKFFQQKISAVQKIVENAEKEINGLNYDETFVNNNEDCEIYKQNIESVHVYNTPVDVTNRSGVHTAVEAYKCENSVIRDFEWTGMKKIEKTFVDNSKGDKNLLRQYIGTYSGLTRLYPTFQWATEPLLSVDLFDPRFRPWFFTAESAPKDILFLLDYSGSVKGQNLHLIKVNVMQALAQLTPNDYFNAIWYNHLTEFMLESCASDRFIPATTRNKRLFQDFLNKVEENGQASLPQAMNMSLIKYLSDEYVGATRQNHTSGGHQLIFLFTDGIEFWPTEEIRKFKADNPDKTIRVFGYAIGRDTGIINILKWITCETGGYYTNVDSIPEVKMNSRMHLSKLSEPLAYALKKQPVNKRDVRFSFPYMDTQNEGAVISISSPIVNRMFTSNGTVEPDENNSFIGVAGVDFSIESLRLLLPNTEQIKSFIVDNNGIVFFHPDLKLPNRELYSIRRTACHIAPLRHRTGTRIQFGPVDEHIRKLMGYLDSIPTLDIVEIESNFTSKFASFRNSMVRRDCNKLFDDTDKQYKCIQIPNTPLTLGFILYKNKQVLELDERVERLVYEESELVSDWVRNPSLCSEFLSADDELERFEMLVDLAEKNADCLSSTHRSMLSAFGRSVADWRTSWPLLEDNMTCSTNPIPNEFHSAYLTSFVEYAPGIVTFYPKCQFSTVKDFFNNRPQILEDESSDQHVKIHTNLISQTLTLYRSIVDNVTKRQIALVGTQFKPQFFNSIWSDLLKKSSVWKICKNTNGRCYIVTKEGFILASSDLRLGITHLAAKEPILFDQLVSTNSIKSFTVIDYQAKCYIGPQKHHTASVTPTSSAIRPIRLLSHIAAMAYSWLTLDLFGDSKFAQEECHFQFPEMNEQCVMKYPIFEIAINKSTTIAIKPRKSCSGSATIVPSGHLYVMLVDGNCQSSREAVSKHHFIPIRVPECNLAKRRVRYRISNIDYNITYPDEKTQECSFSNRISCIITLNVFLLFIPKLFI